MPSPAHGQLTYLQVPATDVARSAVFYQRIFGWQVDPPQPGFEAPGLIGQWVTDRPAAPGAGMLAWIQVDRLSDTLDLVRANGGAVVLPPFPDGTERLLATITDPAGNALGLPQNITG
jgi:predicted enzyme related to lactoylglutathione lyase